LSLIAELQRRRVFRVLIAYGVVAFAVLQIVEPIMHGLHWPEEVLSYVVVGLALGLPVVVGVAWSFDVKAGRIERTGLAPEGTTDGLRLGIELVLTGAFAAAPLIYSLIVHRTQPNVSAAPSIAVLPFVDMSSGKENDYFSDGITEELINALANVEGLHVVSRTAVFALKGKNLDIDQIGAQLKVSTLLEGSVRREGNALRITAQLINVSDGYHLWSKSYDREVKNVFALEDEIARSIAQSLRRTLVHSDGVKAPTANLEAHDLYLKGIYFWNKRSSEGLRKAEELFEQAISEDPDYALAYTGLANTLMMRLHYGGTNADDLERKAESAAQRALELDPGLAEAHCALADVAESDYDWTTAVREYRKAIEIKPDYATAHQWLAEQLANMGRITEAREEIGRALEADPTSLIINSTAGTIEYYGRNYDGALERFRKTLEMDPSFAQVHRALTDLYIAQKRYPEALAEAEQHEHQSLTVVRAIIDGLSGRREDAVRAVREIDAESKNSRSVRWILGDIWVAIGEKDKAFPLLMDGCRARSPQAGGVKIDPYYDSIRTDPRYAELLKCVNLE
jgi:serine/threonine-protein kinase